MTRTLLAGLVGLVGLLGLLTGCAGPHPHSADLTTESIQGATRDPETGLRVSLDLVEKLLEQGSHFAALASLDALDDRSARSPEARLLRAECLRRMGRTGEARRVYRELRGTPLAGHAHRGLGLLAAQRGELTLALRELTAARIRLPTAAQIRNDLGFALLLVGRDDEARVELLTALELGHSRTRAERNLLLLLLLGNDEGGAEALARKAGFDAATLTAIRKDAEWFRRIRAARSPSAGGGIR